MADHIQRSFEGLSINRGGSGFGGDVNQMSHIGTIPSPNSANYDTEASSSLRTPASTFGNAQFHGQGGGSLGGTANQTAAARFERFFNSGSGSSPQGVDMGALHSSNAFAPPQMYSSLGSGSSAAGLASSGAFGSFGHNFSGGGASRGQSVFGNNSTMPAARPKPLGVRQGIPSQWGTGLDEGLTSSSPPPQFGAPGSFFVPSPTSAFPGMQAATSQTQAAGLNDDDIIPTAIVVKNIPFSIKREQLLQIIEDLQIPMPYAFNYHYDQGVFRGLAFANFRSGEEADGVVAALNGFDVAGRKLRVEYKKVLQAGEKERIEKEKAIKRMQSMQLEKDRARRQGGPSADDWTGAQMPMPSASTISPPLSKPPGIDLDSGYGETGNDQQQRVSADLQRTSSDSQSEHTAGGASESGAQKVDLDLNDPATLEIYSRVLLFKDDRMRDDLSFSKNLTTNERRIVHMVAKRLNLYHYSLGEGEERYVIVTKHEVNQTQRPLRNQSSTIGRSNRTAGEGAGVGGSGLLMPGSSHTTGRMALRTKKSAPDMKRQRERSEDGAFNAYGYGTGTSSSGGGVHGGFPIGLSRKSNGNLREGYSASTGRRSAPSGGAGAVGGAAGLQSLFSSPFDIPPVPSLPINPPDGYSHSPSPSPIGSHNHNGSISAATSQHILRQPTGPGASNRNFAQRSRVPIGGGGGGNSGAANDALQSVNGGGGGNHDVNGFVAVQHSSRDLGDDETQSHQPLEV